MTSLSPPPLQSPGEDSRRLPVGFGALWSTVAVDMVGFGIVLPLLPLYAERFGAGAFAIGCIVASFSLAQLVFAPWWGRISDRYGRRPVLIVSLVGTAVGSLITGLAWFTTGGIGIAIVLVGRLIDGASGASVSVAQAAATDLARSPVERARLVGLLGASFGVGFVAGPAIGALGALGGPAVPFFIASALAATNALVALKRLPETRPTLDLSDSASAAAADPLAQTPSLPANANDRERADEIAVVDHGRRVSLRMLVVGAGLVTAAFAGFEATFALVVQDELLGGLSERERLTRIGLLFAAIGVVIVGVQAGLVRRAVSRLGEYRTLLVGLVSLGVGFALLGAFASSRWLLLSLLPLAVGQGLAMAALSSMLGGSAHALRRGRAFGVQQRSAGIGRVIGPVVGGAALSLAGSSAPALVGLVVIAGVFALVVFDPTSRQARFAEGTDIFDASARDRSSVPTVP